MPPLEALARRGALVLEEKRRMDFEASELLQRLQERGSERENLEDVLQEINVKQRSGALHRAVLPPQLLSSARVQLQAQLQQKLEDLCKQKDERYEYVTVRITKI